MQSGPDHLVFTDIKLDEGKVTYESQGEEEAGSIQRAALASRLEELGVQIA